MLSLYFRETRPQFLFLTPVCCLVGASVAFWRAGTINVVYLVIAFLGALAAHVAVNVLNDYFDFQSGLDLHTKEKLGFLQLVRFFPEIVGNFLFTKKSRRNFCSGSVF